MLAAKYGDESWVALWEVRDTVGFGAVGSGREADCLVFGVWPSRGLQILGFEIKSDRRDWLRELKNPAKAEGFASHCDQWWLVTGPDVAKAEEIPVNWGWLVAKGKRLVVEKQPVPLSPKEVGRALLMSIVRNVSRAYVPKRIVNERVKAEAEAMAKDRYDSNRFRLEELEKMAKRLHEFKVASGIDLSNSWNFDPKTTGELVRLVLDGMLPREVEDIRRTAVKLEELMKAVMAMPFMKVKDQK